MIGGGVIRINFSRIGLGGDPPYWKSLLMKVALMKVRPYESEGIVILAWGSLGEI